MEVRLLEVQLHELKCSNCGASLKYHPGQQTIACPYCGAQNQINYDEQAVAKAWEEKDFEKHIKEIGDENIEPKKVTLKCPGCGAQVEVDDKTIATVCPYCGTSLTLEHDQIQRKIKPQAVVPFKIDKKQAKHEFVKWAKSRWFAPAAFKKHITAPSKFKAIYIPYWTFDADTVTDYEGERGVYYYVTVTYTDSDGNQSTREERRTEWYPVSGSVRVKFDDVLVNGKFDNPIPAKIQDWQLSEIKPFDPRFISGFEAEAYTIKLHQAFENAKKQMEYEIIRAVKRDIGGDEQRIHKMTTYFHDVTFKHILVPVYLSQFKYKDKTYKFAINGQTGKVAGKFPVSAWKVALVVFLVLLVLGFIIALVSYNGDINAMMNDIFGTASQTSMIFHTPPWKWVA